MITLLVLLLSLGGFASMALAMSKHHRDIFRYGAGPERRRLLSVSGWFLLTTSLVPALIAHGLLVGTVLWLGMTTPAALLVAMGLSYGQRPNAK